MIHTNYANLILKYITAKSAVLQGTGKCYLGLSTTAPNQDGSNFSEPDGTTYPSYERIQLSIAEALEYTDKWGSIANGTVTNAEEFTSRECLEEGGWPECTHFGIFDCKTGGSPILSDLLRDPDGTIDESTGLYPEKALKVEMNKVAVFRAGTLQLTVK